MKGESIMKERILRALGILFAVALIAGGILTAVIAEEAPTVSIEYFTLSHENAVYIEYAVDYRGFDGVPGNTGMLYWTKEPVKPELGTEDSRSGMLGYDEINGQKYYIFKYANLTAAQMCDDIWACAYATVDGTTYYSNVEKYSVETYAARKLGLVSGVEGTKDETLKDLLRAMLEYGEKAQKHFKDARQDIYPTDILHPVTVTFDADNGTTPTAQTVWRNRKPAKPADPTKDGYTFAGWRNGNTEWNFDTDTVTEDVTLTAHWEEILPSEGLNYSSNGNGTCYVSGRGICTDTEIVIPSVSPSQETVIGVGYRAFRGSNIQSVVLPDSVTYLGKESFENCYSLKSVSFSAFLEDVAHQSFNNCSSLKKVDMTRCQKPITFGFEAFDDCYDMQVDISDIAMWCASSGKYGPMSELRSVLLVSGERPTSINIPEGVASIGDFAFISCTSMTEVTIPASVKQIGQNAFAKCTSLCSVAISSGTRSIGNMAFWGCSNLTDISIPNSVTSIGTDAFSDCNKLIQVENGVWYVDKWVVDCDTSVTDVSLRDNTAGFGDSAFSGCSSLTNITIPNVVTAIGNYVFSGCRSLTSITIPSNVTSIGNSAFYNCSNLTNITIPSCVTSIGISAFSNCSGLVDMTLPFVGNSFEGTANTNFGYIFGTSNYTYNASYVPKSLKTVTVTGNGKIDENAFYGLDWITVIRNWFTVTFDSNGGEVIPSQTVKKGESAVKPEDPVKAGYAFAGWYNGNKVWNFDTDVVTGDVTLTARWTEIPTSKGLKYTSNGDGTCYVSGFGSCKDTNLVIPSYSETGDRVTAIGNYAFGGDSQRFKVTSVVIPEGVTAIGNYAFNDCTALVSVVIPEGVISVGERAFNGCISLVRVAFPDSMVSLGRSAFCYCTSLIELKFGKGLESYGGDILFPENCLESIIVDKDNPYFHSTGNCLIHTESKTLILGCRNSIIPADGSVTIIANEAFEAFYGCKGLTSIVIPECITTIGPDAFYNCDGLTSIIIPNSVQSIGSRAFASCENLTSIIIPDGVKSIPYEAFYFCTSLKSVKIPDSVTSLGHRAFFGCRNLTELLIPDTVTSIGEQAFNECTGLIQKEGGVWYVGSWVVGCDQSVTTVTLRGQVVGIIDRAFQKCNLLTSITLSDGVAFIGEYVFFGCTSLTSVSLPGSVTHIGSDVFYNCDGLTDITYAGTKSQWKSLDKGWEWDHSDRYKVTIHCTDGDIVKS